MSGLGGLAFSELGFGGHGARRSVAGGREAPCQQAEQGGARTGRSEVDAEASGRFAKFSAGSLDDAGTERGSPQPGDDPALAVLGSGGPGEGGAAPHPVRAGTSVDAVDNGISAVELARQLGVRYKHHVVGHAQAKAGNEGARRHPRRAMAESG